MQDEDLDAEEAALKASCEVLVKRMVRSGELALSRFDGYEHCWFDLVPGKRSGEDIVLRNMRRPRREDYHRVHCGSEIGLLGILPIDGKEVYLPTRAAWTLAGLKFDPGKPFAPEKMRRPHAST